MLTKKELDTINLFESNCVNIGYNMCKAEALSIFIDLIKECESKEELLILRKAKEKIMNLECVWERQPN